MSAHLRSIAKTSAYAATLFAVNVYVCRELFRTTYLNQMGSIEAAFISLARYIEENYRDLTWFPLWYNGIPYQDSYPPLLHWTVALLAGISGWSPALAYHAVIAFLYCLAPVTLFYLCLGLSGSRIYSFAAGVIYSFFSPAVLIVAETRHELGFLRPNRLHKLLAFGEGPHVAGLVLLPLAILMLHRSATRRRAIDIVLCAIAFAATVMANWIAALALFAASAAYLCSMKSLRAVTVAAPISALAYGLVMPWLPPSTISTIRFNAPFVGGDYAHAYSDMVRNLTILGLAVVLVVSAVRKLVPSLPVRFGAIFTFCMAGLVVPSVYWSVSIVPQPNRYDLEMEIGMVIVAAFVLQAFVSRTPRLAQFGIAALALAIAFVAARHDRRFARYLMSPIDITQTIEYKTAVWLDHNLHGERVFAPGSTAFWMNAFTDSPQLSGGFDNGIVNQSTRIARYIIGSGAGAGDRDTEISILWLKAMGVHAVAVGGPHTTQAYKDFLNPKKFDGVLPMIWHEGDDSVYLVPTQSPSLARIVNRADLPARSPVNGIDIEPLRAYVAALDNPAMPEAAFRWTSRHSAAIDTNLRPPEVISVQVSYHPGWHATVNGASTPIREDGLGHIYIDAQCNGACSVLLNYDGGREMRVAWAVFWIAWMFALAVLARSVILQARPTRAIPVHIPTYPE